MSSISSKKIEEFGVINVTAWINVDIDTGRIYSTGINKSNDNYYALYNVYYNNDSFPTIAYFTITVYNKPIIGSGLGSAVGTHYVTLKSKGPM